MKRVLFVLVLCAVAACAGCAFESPYRLDVDASAPGKFSTDLRYFLVEAGGSIVVRAVDKATGTVVWEQRVVAGDVAKALRRDGTKFVEVTAEEARAALKLTAEADVEAK